MPDMIRTWVLSLASAALCCSILTEITPKGSVKNIVKALCGMVMTLTLISPILQLDMGEYSLNMAQYRENAQLVSGRAQEISDRLSRTIIEEQCRTYILDKAQELGAQLDDAFVSVKWSSQGLWYPVGCTLSGEYSARLEKAIEAELGIAPQEQEWIDNENH